MLGKTIIEKVDYTLDVNDIPGTFERRVFIGGSYTNIAILREISKLVLGKGYQPILASDFIISKENIREYTLMLLCNCRYAIFDISIRDAGHIVEIERAYIENKKILLLYQVINFGEESKETAMIDLSNYLNFGYTSFKDLENYIYSFLPT